MIPRFPPFLAQLVRRPKTLFSGATILFLALVAILAPFLSPFDPSEPNLWKVLSPPSSVHLLGTDDLGRDLLSRIIYGTRVSLLVGLVAVGIATIIGIILGSIAGFYGGPIDWLTMRLVDTMLCIPTFFLILAVIAFLGPNIIYVMIVIGVTSWMGIARLVRAEFLSLREREFVLAARAVGARNLRIIIRHILPQAISPIMVIFTMSIAIAILIESSLSFLGIGVQPPTPSWGNIINAGKDNINIAWWMVVFPGIAIAITFLSWFFLGEGIREATDPRLNT